MWWGQTYIDMGERRELDIFSWTGQTFAGGVKPVEEEYDFEEPIHRACILHRDTSS